MENRYNHLREIISAGWVGFHLSILSPLLLYTPLNKLTAYLQHSDIGSFNHAAKSSRKRFVESDNWNSLTIVQRKNFL